MHKQRNILYVFLVIAGAVLLSLFLRWLRTLPAHDALYLSMFPQVAMALFLLYVTLRTLSLYRKA